MKKLIALILCVMLLSGLFAVAAYAENESNAVVSNGVNLKPAYDAMQGLYEAYGRLAGATLYKISYEGFQQLGVKKPDMHIETFISPAPLSYEGLFEQTAPEIYAAYGQAAEAMMTDVKTQIDAMSAAMTAQVTAAVEAMTASMIASIPHF